MYSICSNNTKKLNNIRDIERETAKSSLRNESGQCETKAPKWHQITSQTTKKNYRKFTRAHRSSRNKLLSELKKTETKLQLKETI
jgi:hypothetical protein